MDFNQPGNINNFRPVPPIGQQHGFGGGGGGQQHPPQQEEPPQDEFTRQEDVLKPVERRPVEARVEPKPAPKLSILKCPLMSINSDSTLVCIEENCAWYLANKKTCAVTVLAQK